MGKFILLMLKNLGRNKLRTTLTAFAVTVLVTICVVVLSVVATVRQQLSTESSQAKLIVTERWVAPSEVPVRYLPRLTRIRGVEDWTTWNLYVGFFDKTLRSDRAGLGFATRVENLTRMHGGLEDLDPAVIEEMKQEKSGVLMGSTLMQAMNWKVGQQFTFFSTSTAGKDLRFKIVGVMPAGVYPLSFFFRDDYFAEGTGNKDTVSLVWLRLRDAKLAPRVISQIQHDFANSQPALKVETESSGVARFVEKGQVILVIIDFVALILSIDMVILLANSISISTRERRVEMAVLKVLGFQPLHIVAMVVGEAMLIGSLSGFAGAALAWGASALAQSGQLPSEGFTGFLLVFPVSPKAIAWGAISGASIGFVGSIFPAMTARKVKVSDVFSRIA